MDGFSLFQISDIIVSWMVKLFWKEKIRVMVSQIITVHFLFFLLNGTLQDVIRIVPASPFSCGGKCRLVFA